MIMTMINLDKYQQTILIVVFDKSNLDRMGQADPITLESVKKGGLLPVPAYPQNFSILLGYEENDAELYRMAKIGGVELLKWLERGRKWTDQDGRSKSFMMPKEGTGKSTAGEKE